MFSVAKDSLTKSFNKPIPWLALVVIPLIVALFGTLYAVTYNDPFGRMESMPVALINLDEGVEAENGATTNYGDDIIDSLLEENSVLWTEESAALLDAGLETTDYYLAVVIPEDFSELVSAGETSNPEVANITFYKNQRKNYLLATLSSSLENSLRTAVNEQISAQYATALAEGLISAEDGFSQAAEGSDTLVVGLQSAIEGSEALESGTVELAEGAETLSSGLSTLASGTEELSSGINTLAQGASSLEAGTSTISAGLTTLSEQNETLTAGSTAVASGLENLVAGSDTFEAALAENISSIEESIGSSPDTAVSAARSAYEQELSNYATAVADAVQNGKDPSSVSTDNLTVALTALSKASAAQGSYEALTTVQSNYASLASGISALSSQYETLDSGIITYTDAVSELASGAQQLESGATDVSEGLLTVQSAANALETGSDSAYTATQQLAQGATTLASGATDLTSGLDEAADGADELTYALTEGADSIAESLTTDAETMGEYVSQPVDLTDDIYGEVDNFGTGMAPLFLSLCMWLGSLLIFFVFEAFPSHKYLGVNRLRAIVGRWPLYLLFVVAEIVAVTAACVGFNLQMTSLPLLVLTLTCMGFTFMCIMQCLNLFDVIGKAIAVILIICQLVFCYSTFPAFLGSDIAVAVAPFLPFYYSIDALREVISGGVASAVYADLGMLLLFAVGAIVASLVLYPLALRLKRYRDAQAVQDITGKSLEAIQAGA